MSFDRNKKGSELAGRYRTKTLEAVENIENLITFGRLRAQSVGELAHQNPATVVDDHQAPGQNRSTRAQR
jgi:hypothetical protein